MPLLSLQLVCGVVIVSRLEFNALAKLCWFSLLARTGKSIWLFFFSSVLFVDECSCSLRYIFLGRSDFLIERFFFFNIIWFGHSSLFSCSLPLLLLWLLLHLTNLINSFTFVCCWSEASSLKRNISLYQALVQPLSARTQSHYWTLIKDIFFVLSCFSCVGWTWGRPWVLGEGCDGRWERLILHGCRYARWEWQPDKAVVKAAFM